MYKITATNQFKKDYKKAKKRGLDIKELEKVVDILAKEKMLDAKYKDHELVGNYIGFRECHIKPVQNFCRWQKPPIGGRIYLFASLLAFNLQSGK